MFKNSPLATKYQRRVEGHFPNFLKEFIYFDLDLVKAVNTIIRWWRPLHIKFKKLQDKKSVNYIYLK